MSSKFKTNSGFQEKSQVFQDQDLNFKTFSGNSGKSRQFRKICQFKTWIGSRGHNIASRKSASSYNALKKRNKRKLPKSMGLTIHRVLLLSKSKKINCRLEFCAFLASTGHTEANVVPEKLIYRYTYELPAKTHCPDGPLGSIFWCYLGQPSKMAR